MKNIYTCAGWFVELAILGGLCWIHFRVTDLGIQNFTRLIFFILLPILSVAHWIILKVDTKIEKRIRLKLVFLTGPCIFLCFLLVFHMGLHLKNVKSGNISKDIQWEAQQKKIPMQYWIECNVERMESELISYVLLLASLCITYNIRSTATCVHANDTSEFKKLY